MPYNWNLNAPCYVPSGKTFHFVERSTEEFRCYLEEHGVTDAFTRALAELHKIPSDERPADPLDFVLKHLSIAPNHSLEDELLNNILEDFLDKTETNPEWRAEYSRAAQKPNPEIIALAMHIIQQNDNNSLTPTRSDHMKMPTKLDEMSDVQLRVLERQLADLCLRASVFTKDDATSPTTSELNTPIKEKDRKSSTPEMPSNFSSPDSGVFDDHHYSPAPVATNYLFSKSFTHQDFGNLF